jgi:hypothetical protein
MRMRNTASKWAREADLTGNHLFSRATVGTSFIRVKPVLSYRSGTVRRLTILMLLLAACGGAAADQTGTSDDQPPTASTAEVEPVTTSSGDGAQSADAPDTPTTTLSDRPLAPDFTLALGDGGEFTLSETSKPVYLIFWAEW